MKELEYNNRLYLYDYRFLDDSNNYNEDDIYADGGCKEVRVDIYNENENLIDTYDIEVDDDVYDEDVISIIKDYHL